MAKTKRRWIELDYNNSQALRAEDIPYDATMSVKEAIVWLNTTGIQGPAGVTGPSGGPIGGTGIQGITGLGDLQPGVTGIQGITGLIGIQGALGNQGETGLGVQGATGVVLPSAMPSAYQTINTTTDIVSSSFVDIPNLFTTITLDSTGQLFSTMSFEIESYGAGSYPTGSFRIVFSPGPSGPDSTGTELEKYLLPDDVSLGTVTHYSPTPYTGSGTVTIKGQARRASGQQKVRINNAQLYAQSLIGGKGDVGSIGATGIEGLGLTGLQGIQGYTGFRGVYGHTGVQGRTGIEGLGLTGLQGIAGQTGILGPQGITGPTPELTNQTSSFVYFDSTSQLYDNTSEFIDIPGLSTTFVMDTSGAKAYSTMTILADSTSSPSGGGYVEAAMRLVIDDQTSLEYLRYVQNDYDLNSNTIPFETSPLADGTHTAKGQIKITDSDGDFKYFRVQKAQLFVLALEGSVGPQGVQGLRGYDGATGIKGATGLRGATGLQGLGVTGAQGLGVTGLYGATGIGETGVQGFTGIQGLGVTGLLGPTGIQGETGVQGFTGIQGLGVTGLLGPTGIQGETGTQGLGVTGLRGMTGLGVDGGTGIQGQTGILGLTGQTGIQGEGTQILYNPVNRYQAAATSGAEVWLVSSSAVYHGLDWTRSGSALTLSRTGHGHIAGNRVIVRNTNVDYLTTTIDSTTANTFSVTTPNTDGTVGYDGAYNLGFTYAHDGVPTSAGVVYAPSGDHSDCQLISARIRTGIRTGSTYALQVPASAYNGAGSNTGLSDCYIPDFNVRADSDSLSAVAATMITNVGGSYSTFEFGNLGSNSLSRFIIVHF